MTMQIPNQAFGLADQPPVVEQPIDPRLDDTMLQRMAEDIMHDLEAAESAKRGIDARTKRYRSYMAVDSFPQEYENQPNHRVPYTRGKINGASAHFRAALDQDPFFVTRPQTEEAALVQGPWETMMEREIDRSGTRSQIWKAIDEGLTTGTGMLQLSVAEDDTGEYVIQGKAIRLEDFFVAPAGVENINRTSTFYRYKEPWHVIRRHFDNGFYDQSAYDRMVAAIGSQKRNYDEEVEGTDNFQYTTENAPRELYECFYRWGHEDIGYTLWRVIYHKQDNIILRAVESEYLSAFDSPPYAPLRPLPRIDFFFGESYSQVLEGVQNILDYAFNSYLAYMQMGITPIVYVNEESEAYDLIKNKKLAPGMIIPTVGNPSDSVMVQPMPPAQNPLELMQTAKTLGDDATFNDLMLQGIPTNTVRSATEINAVVNTATKHLARDLKHISVDLGQFAMMYWRLIYDWKIRPLGVRKVFEGSDEYMISVEQISQSDLGMRMLEFLAQKMGVGLDQQTIQAMAPVMQQMMGEMGGDEFFIAGALRDDIEWVVNGGTLVPEKAARANKLERLLATFPPVIQYARQFRPMWEMAKKYLISIDVMDWRKLLPAQPPTAEEMPPEAMQQMAQFQQAAKQGGGIGS